MAGSSEQTGEQIAVADAAAPVARPVAAAPPAAVQGDVAPDWATLSEDICCPLCEYNLRGLAEARCPECGARYTWAELLDPRTQRHPYLFEHHPEANLWSFWRTLIGGLRPWTFWRSMHPLQRCSSARLILYELVIFLAIPFCVLAIEILRSAIADTEFYFVTAGYYQNSALQPLRPTLSDSLRTGFDQVSSASVVTVAISAIFAFWPLMTFLSLMVFQISMHRAKVGPLHVLRCVIYSLDHFFLLGLWLVSAWFLQHVLLHFVENPFGFEPTVQVARATTIYFVAFACIRILMHSLGDNLRGRIPFRMLAGVLNVAVIAMLPVLFGDLEYFSQAMLCIACVFGLSKLIIAFNAYLQFHRPLLTVITSQIITLLLTLCLLLICGQLIEGY